MANFVFLRRRSFFKNCNVTAEDAAHFHGQAMRGGKFPNSTDARPVFDVDYRPMRIKKNIHFLPDIFCPEGELVVAEPIALELYRTVQVESFQVEFEILFNLDYRSTSVERYDEYMRQIDAAVGDASIELPPYFHIHMSWASDVKTMFPDFGLREVSIKQGMGIETKHYLASTEIFERYPIYDSGGYVMDKPVFDVLYPHLKLDYFVFGEGEY